METFLDWLRHAGLIPIVVLITWQLFSAAVTHAFRDRSEAELAEMKAKNPWGYKALMMCKALGIDSPKVWAIIGGIVLARANVPQGAVGRDDAPPSAPPLPPHDSLRRWRFGRASDAHVARLIAALIFEPDDALRAEVSIPSIVAHAVTTACQAVGSVFRHGFSVSQK